MARKSNLAFPPRRRLKLLKVKNKKTAYIEPVLNCVFEGRGVVVKYIYDSQGQKSYS